MPPITSFRHLAALQKIALSKPKPLTLEETKASAASVHKRAEASFAREAPAIQTEVQSMKTPLSLGDDRFLRRALFRRQITMEMIPEKVLAALSARGHSIV